MTCSTTKIKLYAGNDQTITLEDLVDEETSDPITGADLTATLTDGSGNEIAGLTDLAMVETGSPFTGDYSCEVDGSQFNPPESSDYTLTITADSPGNFKLTIPVTVCNLTQ